MGRGVGRVWEECGEGRGRCEKDVGRVGGRGEGRVNIATSTLCNA